MYTCLIVEDEAAAGHQIESLLKEYHSACHLIGLAGTVTEGLQMIRQHQPDILFLDINLGAQTGFDLLKQVPNPAFETIIVTGYDHFAIEAIRCCAADYLLKPVQPVELADAIQRATRRLDQDRNGVPARMKDTLDQWYARMAAEHVQIALPLAGEQLLVKASEIVRLEANGSYTQVHFANGPMVVISRGLFSFEQKLAGLGFIRCHAAHLVNRRYIRRLLQSDGIMELELQNLHKITVSRAYHRTVKDILRTF